MKGFWVQTPEVILQQDAKQPVSKCGERDRQAVIGSKGERNMYSSYRDRKHLNCMETAKEVIFYSNLDNANV
jgi:hypothetical protein